MKDETISNQKFFSKILEAKPNNLFHYSNIGYQTFFVSPLAINMLNELNFDTLRLGNVTSKIRNVEPVLRNTDMLSFDLSSIKSSDLNANKYSSPNGLSSVEACKIMRYAGLSDKLSLLAICEYNQLLDLNGLNAQLVSQMIWYFLDGIKSTVSRKTTVSYSKDGKFNFILDLFKKGGGELESKRLDVPLLGKIPILEKVMLATDDGIPITAQETDSSTTTFYTNITENLLNQIKSQGK